MSGEYGGRLRTLEEYLKNNATLAKPNIYQEKVLLCFWRDRKCPVKHTLLKQGQMSMRMYTATSLKIACSYQRKMVNISVQKRNRVSLR